MYLRKQQHVFFLSVIVCIYVLAWIVQCRLFLSWDVSYLMHATMRLLSGGTYSKDFFNPNPPMILYLYIPPVVFSQILTWNIILTFRIYIFILASLSIFISYLLVRKIFLKQDDLLVRIFVVTLSSVFLVLPLYEFGQREHLLVILTMPYLLSIVYQLQGNIINKRYAIVVGLLAGLGFAIKPQFLIMLLLVELYYTAYKKNIFAWMRVETGIILGIITIHAAVIFFFYPDYLSIIIPYVMRNYYYGIGQSWHDVACYPIAIFCCIAILFYAVRVKNSPYGILNTILLIALIGFLFSYFLQRTIYYYHIVPAFSLAILLCVLLFSLFVSKSRITKIEYFFVMLLGIIIIAFLLYFATPIWATIVFYPIMFFCYFSVLLAFIFGIIGGDKSVFKIFGMVSFIIMVGFLCSYLAQHTLFYPYRFIITAVSMVIVFCLFAARIDKRVSHHIFTAILGMLIFAYPVYAINNIYSQRVVYKANIAKLIEFLHVNAWHRPVAFFDTTTIHAFPGIDYAENVLGQRYDCLWMVAGLVNQVRLPNYSSYSQYAKDKNFLIDMITEDLDTHKPDLVFIDVKTPKAYITNLSFDYLTYFSENQKFRDAWKSYRYLTTISEDSMYKLRVYERIVR